MAIAETSHGRRHAAGHHAASWPRILAWTLLFQIAWFWRRIPDLITQGAMPDTDDFQRLSQIRQWMAGQPWYDVANYRMSPPGGADMHWSRLVDVPIAAITGFLQFFLDAPLAERVASIVWPLCLLSATVFVIIAICRRLERDVNPLVVLLFTVTCFTALTEFMPGRLDHHSVQILLFCVLLLCLVHTGAAWAGWLAGTVMAASLSIGLDSILLFLLVLAWAGLSWALGRAGSARFMRATGSGLLCALPLFLAVNLPYSQWLAPRCDALSAVYLVAFGLAGAGFILLPLIDSTASRLQPALAFAVRACAGLAAASIAGGVTVALFPQCAGGPYGSMPPELVSKWLVNVSEARGLIAQLESTPQMWIAVLAYGVVILAVAFFVLMRRHRESPEYLALFAVLLISFLASFLQYRALRIGIFASIPFCVSFASIAWEGMRSRFAENRALAMAGQAALVALLLSPTWLGIGAAIFPEDRHSPAGDGTAYGQAADWRKPDSYIFCNRQEQYAQLAGLAPGYVMTDINSGAPALVFTGHAVVGGPYHRNGGAILDMMDFFGTDGDTAREIARGRSIDYVAYCEPLEPMTGDEAASDSLSALIRSGNEPAWLERVSRQGQRMHVFRVAAPAGRP